MSLPDSDNEVTARRLSAVLTGLFSKISTALNLKADKVANATNGHFAALDANGNLTDSGSKVADFKTKQTPVTDPSASGAGLEFIDSVTQDANGVVAPHKKSVQDGTTSQKGVVQLNNAIDSTSTTEAATPKAVKDAYDELNNKIVARAVFLSQQEWAAQSLLPGDPAKVYYVENGTGEDAYTVYVWKESTSTYEEVDESSIDLDGYWHDGPTTTGNGNVVTSITLGNDGVPQVEKGLTALTQHQDISGKADKVSGATSGNLAGLDANGNLTDSGKKASDFEPSFSVLPISKGGTGKTTGKAATNNLFSDISSDTNDPVDNTILVYKYTTPSDNAGIFYTRPLSKLWNYIKGKISSVLGLSENGYTGNAATATNATNATTAAGYTNDGGIANALVGKSDTNHAHDDRYVRYDTNSQGLTNAQKSNARTNIGAGTSSLTLGDSYNTASPGNHMHGLLANDGSFGSQNWAVSNLDRIVIAKNNYNGKEGYLVPSALSFDGNESDRALTQSAEWKKFLPPTGDGSSVSVTPDGTSTGTDIGNSTTLKALAQKFKNLVGALKSVAFSGSYSDLSGTPSIPSVINNLTSTSTTDALSAAQGKALNDNKQANLPTSGTASTTYAINISGNAAKASYATGASNYTADGTIASALSLRAPLNHEHSASDITSGTFGASRLDIGVIRKSGNYFVPRMPILWASGNVDLMTNTDSVLAAVRDNGYGTPITVINGTTSQITVTGVYPSKGTTTIAARKSRIFTYYNANNGFFDAN